tara:strand:+ start:865 stop:1896 length:1032 start_codon:yes stop_codon:yes gene_type:complete
MPGPLLDCLHGKIAAVPPVWFMRQAGRYLPEYRALREEKGGFLDLVYDSEAACEITIQPIRRFGFDGAILFSDILIVPHAMGQDVRFLAGEGPALSPRLADASLDDLTPDPSHFDPIYQTLRLLREELSAETTLLGFAGSPWTVATYMVEGQGSKDQGAARSMAHRERNRFTALIDAIASHTTEYLIGQIDAGAEAVQLFDSWSGSLPSGEFDEWVIAPTRRIVDAIRSARPGVPIIGFPKGAGEKLPRYAEQTGVDAIGLDETLDPVWADSVLPKGLPVQGNLDPMLLLAGGERLDAAVIRILDALQARPHVFNLGHGIDRFTPIAHVEQALATLRNWQRRA